MLAGKVELYRGWIVVSSWIAACLGGYSSPPGTCVMRGKNSSAPCISIKVLVHFVSGVECHDTNLPEGTLFETLQTIQLVSGSYWGLSWQGPSDQHWQCSFRQHTLRSVLLCLALTRGHSLMKKVWSFSSIKSLTINEHSSPSTGLFFSSATSPFYYSAANCSTEEVDGNLLYLAKTGRFVFRAEHGMRISLLNSGYFSQFFFLLGLLMVLNKLLLCMFLYFYM